MEFSRLVQEVEGGLDQRKVSVDKDRAMEILDRNPDRIIVEEDTRPESNKNKQFHVSDDVNREIEELLNS
jgi:hypothetical protein